MAEFFKNIVEGIIKLILDIKLNDLIYCITKYFSLQFY